MYAGRSAGEQTGNGLLHIFTSLALIMLVLPALHSAFGHERAIIFGRLLEKHYSEHYVFLFGSDDNHQKTVADNAVLTVAILHFSQPVRLSHKKGDSMKYLYKKPLFGVQGTVMGWDDPWHPEASKTKMRTGEGKIIPSQDLTPSPDIFIQFIKEMGVNLYVHHVMPEKHEISDFLSDIQRRNINFIMGNEYGNINGPYKETHNRYDIPAQHIKNLNTAYFKGLLYDETEHLQLHPNQYLGLHPKEIEKKKKRHQWTSTTNKNVQKINEDIVTEVKALQSYYGEGVRLFSEQVFPVMYHTLSRGGLHPCPKLLKEEFQSVQLSTAIGASKQYNRQLGICVDLWGPDIGNWFTRTWGFPGHSPEEFESALKIAYLMSPDFVFVENIDALAQHKKNTFEKTIFGEIYEKFLKQFVPENPIRYEHTMILPDIVVIRSDDCDFGGGEYLLGSDHVKSDYRTQSSFQVFHLLSHGTLPVNGLTYFLPQFEYYAFTQQKKLTNTPNFPLKSGFEQQTHGHALFYPMNNVLVMDEHVNSQQLGQPKLIIVAGSRLTSQCFNAVIEKVKEGAVCIVAEWLLKENKVSRKYMSSRKEGKGKWIVTEDFLSPDVRQEVLAFIGDQNCWRQRFGNFDVCLYNPGGDGIRIEHEVVHCE